jgi:hypothetical protein
MHVVRQGRVSRVVKSFLIILNNEATRIAPVAAVGKLARVDRVDELYPAKIKCLSPTVIEGMRLLDPLLVQPSDDLEV